MVSVEPKDAHSDTITISAPASNAPINSAVRSGSPDANGGAPTSSSISTFSSSCEQRWCGRAFEKCVAAAKCVWRGVRRALSAVGCVLALLVSPFIYVFTFLFWLFTLPVSCICSSLSHLLTSLDVARLFRFRTSASAFVSRFALTSAFTSASASAASSRRHPSAASGADEDALERTAYDRIALLQAERDIDL